ncbi:hypothetical protein B296_00051312 [Ensete ventricosum]|uniref:Uncharacterized protein n=1 Tax=Ensete ventricosum TaxID=4639 RepID=A0A426Y3I6_ENSVE|nr:hypothetical protein B296_00051312 [Ensete ventricosum]
MASQPFSISDAGCYLPVPDNAAASFLLPPDYNSKNSLLRTKYCATLGKRSQFQEVAQNSAVKRPRQGTPVSDISQAEKDVMPGKTKHRRVKLSKKRQENQISQLVVACDQRSCPLVSETSKNTIPEVEVQMTSQLYKEVAKGMVKEEPTEAKVLCRSDLVKGKKENLVDARSKILKQQLSVQRSLPFHLQCDKDGPSIVKPPKNGDASRKRKSTQGYQVSAESSDQFPVSWLGENQITSLGTSRTCQEVAATKLQKEDTALDPVASVGTASMTSVSNSTLGQVSKMILKKKPKALTSAFAEGTMGINFDTSVNATRVQDISNGSLAEIVPAPAPSEANDDTTILEKFSKIQIITQRSYSRMDVGLGMGHTSNGPGMTLNLDHALGRSNVYPFQNRDKSLVHFNKPLMDLCNNTSDRQNQLHVDLQQSLLQKLQHQQLQRLAPPELHNLPMIPAAATQSTRQAGSRGEAFPYELPKCSFNYAV